MLTIRRKPQSTGPIPGGNLLACDTETTGTNPWLGDQPFAFSFCNEKAQTGYLEFPVNPLTRQVDYAANMEDFNLLRKWFARQEIERVFWNAKFDIHMMEGVGIQTGSKVHEGMHAAHICNSLEINYKLKDLARKYLDFPNDDQKELRDAVVKCRRWAKKLGWKTAVKGVQGDDPVSADYWLPGTFLWILGTKKHPLHSKTRKYIDDEKEEWLHEVKDRCMVYATGDAERTMLLWMMHGQVMKEENLLDTYKREETLWPLVYRLEKRGVAVSHDFIKEELKNTQEHIKRSERVFMKHAWEGFNINSAFDLRELLFKKMKLPVNKRTEKTGVPSVKVDDLYDHISNPVVHAIFFYRAMQKGMQFLLQYRKYAVKDSAGDYVIHPSFQQLGPATARFSCREPNLQQVSNAGGAAKTLFNSGARTRNIFIPRKGYRWYSFDYKQLEVRIFAHRCQEPFMLDALRQGRDMHGECAKKAWGKGPKGVDAAIRALEFYDTASRNQEVKKLWKEWGITDPRKLSEKNVREFAERWMVSHNWDIVAAEKSIGKENHRTRAKMILFGKVFGGGAETLSTLIECSVEDAVQFLADYDDAFPRIKEYQRDETRQAKRKGYIVNDFGRRLTIDPEWAYRCVNYGVQSGAADFLKLGMLETDAYVRRTGLDAHLLLTIHDELIFEIRKEHAYKWFIKKIAALMADNHGVFTVDTPVDVDCCTHHWADKRKVEL